VVVGPLKKGLSVALPVISIFFLIFIALSLFSVNTLQSADSRHVFYDLLQNWIVSPWLKIIINILCLSAGAILLSVLTIRHEMVDKQNYIPVFLYVFFNALIMNKELLHPALFANIFILLALNALIDVYREEEALSKIFNAGVYTSLSVFFYLNYTFLIALFFISFSILRPFSWREWIISLLGLVAPVFIYACVGYLANYDFMALLSNMFQLLTFFQKPSVSEYFYPLFITLAVILVVVILHHLSKGLGAKIKTQKAMGLMYWFLLLSLINFFSIGNNPFFPFIASVIPISILFGDYFFSIRQLKIANTIFFLLLAAGSLLFLVHLNVI